MTKRVPAFTVCLFLLIALISSIPACAEDNVEWTAPFPPHHIVGNLYYVGSEDLASYLIVTPQGNILINSNLESSPAQIKKSVEQLGFKFSDTKILLISHAHFDHAAGSATIKKLTGARYEVMDADVPVIEDGGKSDFAYGSRVDMRFPPAKVDRVLHDGDTVTLGGTTLVAHKTAGHTKGCTTWTMTITDHGKPYDVVIVGSPNLNPGYKLVNNAAYPQIATDFQRTFATLKSLHCDIFLGAHGLYYDLTKKYQRMKNGDQNAFVDPDGYKSYVLERQATFEKEVARQQQSVKH